MKIFPLAESEPAIIRKSKAGPYRPVRAVNHIPSDLYELFRKLQHTRGELKLFTGNAIGRSTFADI